jgi:ATP-dependent Lon protease
MFIATSNTMSTIQPAFKDRMEVIKMSGYTTEEKVEIARQHLFPKQLKEHGLKETDLTIDRKQLEKIIEGYTTRIGCKKFRAKTGSSY